MRAKDLFDKLEYFSIRSTLFALMLGALANLLVHEVPTLKDVLDPVGIRRILPTIAISILSILVLTLLIFVFILLLKRQTAKTGDLKKNIVTAYWHALDSSSFNPHRREEKNHEQSNC